MSAEEMQVAAANASDLAADMDQHRYMYRTFLQMLRWVSIGCAVIVAVLFVIMN